MPKPFFIEEPPKEKLEEFLKELKEYKGLEPRLTFNFPLNERRRKALEMLKTGKIEEENVLDLLNSDDFIERRVGISFLKNLPEISKENYEKFLKALEKVAQDQNDEVKEELISSLPFFNNKVLPIYEKLAQDKKWFIRETVASSLASLDEAAIPILEKLAQDEINDVKEKAIYAKLKILIKKKGEKILPLIENLIKDEKWPVKKAAILALGDLKEKALPLLENLSNDKDLLVRIITARALGNIGEKGLPILEKLKNDESSEVRIEVAEALKFPHQESFLILDKLAEDKESRVREKVADVLGYLDERGLPILKKLSQDPSGEVKEEVARSLAGFKDNEEALKILEILANDEEEEVREEAARSLTNFDLKKVKPILEKLAQDEDYFVRGLASFALVKEKAKEWLLFSRKPLFATPYTKELSERILKIQEIAKQLKKEFKDDFIGLIILGSTVKGYFKKESDLDWGIIAKNKKVVERFKKLAQSLPLCVEHVIKPTKSGEIKEDEQILFQGLFFGDNEKLWEIQKKFLKSIDQNEWDEIRDIILAHEVTLIEAYSRFGLSEEDFEKLKISAILLKVPPSYQETIKFLEKK